MNEDDKKAARNFLMIATFIFFGPSVDFVSQYPVDYCEQTSFFYTNAVNSINAHRLGCDFACVVALRRSMIIERIGCWENEAVCLKSERASGVVAKWVEEIH